MKIPRVLRLSKKKAIVLAVVIIVLISASNFFNKSSTQTLQFTQVRKQDIKSTVSSSGTLTGKKTINLKFKYSGKLAYLNVKIGDQIDAYQTVAGLDTQQLNIDLQQAYNTLRDKQAAAEKIEDDVKDHSKDETFSQKAIRTAAQVAKDNAHDSVKEAQRAFQDVILITPIAGLVTQASPIPGQNISASDTIAQIVDFSQIYFDTDIDEADIGKVTVGQKTEITLDAYADKVFLGGVSEIIPQTKTTSSGATVVTVRIKLISPEINLINGLSGQASIILSQAKNTLTLPQEAVRDDETVFIQTDQGLESKKIKIGIKSDTDVEIKEGLVEEDKVLLNPPALGNGFNRTQNPFGGVFRLFGGGRGR